MQSMFNGDNAILENTKSDAMFKKIEVKITGDIIQTDLYFCKNK